MTEGNFAGRVAVVTGAGAGLGRAYVLELARCGCQVVVSDLGGNADGSGSSTGPTDSVADEIRAIAGKAERPALTARAKLAHAAA